MAKNLQSILNLLSKKADSSPVTFLNEKTYFSAIEGAYNMIVITDKNSIIQYANPAVARITGYHRNEVLGRKPPWGGHMDKPFYQNLWKTILRGEVFDGEIRNRRKNGDDYIAKITISPIKNDAEIVGYIGTEEDITLQKQLMKEKEDFISMASHELRTPLGVMKWNIELMAEKDKTNGGDLELLRKTNQEMIDVVNKLLSVLRIRDNKQAVYAENIPVVSLISGIIAEFGEALRQKDIRLHVLMPDTLTARIDRMMMKEIFQNLLENSIKYLGDGKDISVSVKRSGKEWTLSVKDTGIGIGKSDMAHILEKFYRGKNVSHIPGSGLGFYIVNTYVQKMGGTIRIKSALRKGTEVICTFPLKAGNDF